MPMCYCAIGCKQSTFNRLFGCVFLFLSSLVKSKHIIGAQFQMLFSTTVLFFDVPRYSNRFEYIKDIRPAIYLNNQKKSLHIIFKASSLHTLEYRRLQHDLIYMYKILFGRVTVEHSKMFTVTHDVKTRGHQWKLYLTHCCTNLRKHFFHERVIAPWNSLKITPDTVQSIATFSQRQLTFTFAICCRPSVCCLSSVCR